MKKCVILSGGLDSTTLTYQLVKWFGKDNVIAITFNFKQKRSKNQDSNITTFTNNTMELKAAQKTTALLGIQHIIVPLPLMNDLLNKHFEQFNQEDNKKRAQIQGLTAFAYRNALFMSYALNIAVIYGCDEIYLGYQNGDFSGYFDTKPKWVKQWNKLSSMRKLGSPKFITPFSKLEKWQEIQIGQKLGVPYEDTWTCYSPIYKNHQVYACGKCPACLDRLSNFKQLGLNDPLKYIED